jgi:RimJ/RimL family protein N-acetyltransferase
MDRLEMWPVLGLKLCTPRLTMRPVDPELAFDLANLAAEGIHDPSVMPFFIPWTDRPQPELQRSVLRYNHRSWADFEPDSWRLPLAVFEDGELAGMQEMTTHDFPVLRSFSTGSWLGRRFQGRGIGREMRAAVLHLGFAGLGAVRAVTDAYTDNPASLGVTRALGYRPDGTHWDLRRGEPAQCLRFTMDRSDWEAARRDDIHIEGVGDELLAFLGLHPAADPGE